VLDIASYFAKVVLANPVLAESVARKKARLLLNLGLKSEGDALIEKLDQSAYKITDEERKAELEKIKPLKDPDDDLKSKVVNFTFEEEGEPRVLEQIVVH